MKVIFVDVDGVLNSAESFKREHKKGTKAIHHTLCPILCKNFQLILDALPEVKVVISSTWRKYHELDWLKAKFAEYGIDSTRVIGKTPELMGMHRGHEITDYLQEHFDVVDYVILDDNSDMTIHMDKLVQTTWHKGLNKRHVREVIEMLS